MTDMGTRYYPLWSDNLADDVILEAAAMDGTAVYSFRPARCSKGSLVTPPAERWERTP